MSSGSPSKLEVSFSGDDQDLTKVIERMERRTLKLEEALRKAGQEGRKGGQEISGAYTAAIGKAAGMLAGLVSVNTAVSALTGAYRDWERETRQLGKTHEELQAKSLAFLSAYGLAAQRNAVAAKLAAAGVPESVGLDVANAVFAAGTTLGNDRKLAITQQAARLAPAGLPAAAIGGTMARLAGTGKSEGDLADLTIALRQMLGEEAGILQGDPFQRMTGILMGKGMTAERALALQVATAQSDTGAKVLATLVGGSKTAADIEATLADPRKIARMAPGAAGDQLRQISLEAINANERILRDAQRTDLAEQRIRDAAATPEGAAINRRNALQVLLEQRRRARALEGQAASEQEEAFSAATEGMPWWQRAGERAIWGVRYAGERMAGYGPAEAGQRALQNYESEAAEETLKVLREINENLKVDGRPRGVIIDNRHGEN